MVTSGDYSAGDYKYGKSKFWDAKGKPWSYQWSLHFTNIHTLL